MRNFHFVPALLCLLTASLAHAFCYAPQLRVSDEFYVSPVVLNGIVVNSRDLPDPADRDSITGTIYLFRVGHIYHGNVAATIKIYSDNSTARYPMDLNQRYLLFLTKDDKGRWVVDNCGNSKLWSQSAAVRRELNELPLKSSYIYGEVYPYSGPMTCPPMRLTLRGSGREAKTTVRHNCSFQVDVPPGKYSATLMWNGRQVASYDLPYKNPYCFVVPAGGSAGIAFRPDDGADRMNRTAINSNDERLHNLCHTSEHR